MASITIANKKGKKYVIVSESYRNEKGQPRSRVLENHGNLETLLAEDPQYLEKLRARIDQQNELKRQSRIGSYASEAQKFIADVQQKLDGKPGDGQRRYCRRYNLGSALLRKVWKDLTLPGLFSYLQGKRKIEYSYDKATFLLSNERILRPGSKSGAFRAKDKNIYPFEEISDINVLYRVLDCLDEDKQTIVHRINRAISKLTKRDMSLALYDVTTYSFESRTVDELRNFGMSKDHKSGEVQVVLGLVIDQNGIPVDYELFPGNTSEFGTMVPIIQRLRKTYKLDRCIVVADRGLNSNENLTELQKINCDFVIAQKVKNCSTEQREPILSEDGWRSVWDPDTGELVSRFKELEVLRDVHESKVSAKTGRKYSTSKVIGTLDVKWVVSYSERRAKKDVSDINRAVEKAQKAIDSGQPLTSSHGYKSYIKAPKGKGKATLNEEKIAEALKWAGYYAICTNLKDTSPERVTEIYRQLWKIEDCFRVSKTMLEARPCFVWTESHIRGHFLSCYISLVMEKYILHKMKEKCSSSATINRIVEAMREAEVALLDQDPTRPMYIRLYEEGLFDQAFEAFDLVPLEKMEEPLTLCKKIGLRQVNR